MKTGLYIKGVALVVDGIYLVSALLLFTGGILVLAEFVKKDIFAYDFFARTGVIILLFSLILFVFGIFIRYALVMYAKVSGFWTGKKIIAVTCILLLGWIAYELYVASLVTIAYQTNLKTLTALHTLIDDDTLAVDDSVNTVPIHAAEIPIQNFINYYYSHAVTTCSNIQAQWFWSYINEHCPQNMDHNHCYTGCADNSADYTLTFCAIDPTQCAENNHGKCCPYSLCRMSFLHVYTHTALYFLSMAVWYTFACHLLLFMLCFSLLFFSVKNKTVIYVKPIAIGGGGSGGLGDMGIGEEEQMMLGIDLEAAAKGEGAAAQEEGDQLLLARNDSLLIEQRKVVSRQLSSNKEQDQVGSIFDEEEVLRMLTLEDDQDAADRSSSYDAAKRSWNQAAAKDEEAEKSGGVNGDRSSFRRGIGIAGGDKEVEEQEQEQPLQHHISVEEIQSLQEQLLSSFRGNGRLQLPQPPQQDASDKSHHSSYRQQQQKQQDKEEEDEDEEVAIDVEMVHFTQSLALSQQRQQHVHDDTEDDDDEEEQHHHEDRSSSPSSYASSSAADHSSSPSTVSATASPVTTQRKPRTATVPHEEEEAEQQEIAFGVVSSDLLDP